MLAATLTPLTASGNAPGRTVLAARMAARSGRKSAVLRRSAASALVPSNDIQLSPYFDLSSSAKADDPALASILCQPYRLGLLDARVRGHDSRDANRSLFRRYFVRGGYAARLHHHLDGIFDAVLGVADRGRQVVEREGVGVDLGGVESLLAHERFGAVGCALAFPADAIDVDVVAHDLGDIDRRFLVREGGEADFAAAVDHADRLVDGVGRARALEHVIDALAAVEAAHRRNRILAPHVDDLVFAEAAVGGEAVGAVALVHVAVVEAVVVAGGVHALAAALALAAAGMAFDGHALADPVFVDARPERRHGPHIFVPGREVLVVRQAAANQRRRPVIDDLEIGRADRDRVDAYEDFGPLRHRHRLLAQRKLAGIAEHPCFHRLRDGVIPARLDSGWCVHWNFLPAHAGHARGGRAWRTRSAAD